MQYPAPGGGGVDPWSPSPSPSKSSKNLYQRPGQQQDGQPQPGHGFQNPPDQSFVQTQQQQAAYNNQHANSGWGNASAIDSFARSAMDVDDPTGKLVRDAGINYAKNLSESTFAKYMPGVTIVWKSLKYYFDVNNTMIYQKLGRLLFPFRIKDWKRKNPAHGGGEAELVGPSRDINCPDLYIPSMALITFVLIVGLLKGASMSFTPEVLYDVSMSAMMSQTIEVLVIRSGLYTLGGSSGSFFELMALTGYKYVGLCINMVVALIFGWWVYYPCLIYTGLSMAYFMVKTFKANKLKSKDLKSTYFLALIGFFEILLMWYEAYTGDLSKLQTVSSALAPTIASPALVDGVGNHAGSGSK